MNPHDHGPTDREKRQTAMRAISDGLDALRAAFMFVREVSLIERGAWVELADALDDAGNRLAALSDEWLRAHEDGLAEDYAEAERRRRARGVPPLDSIARQMAEALAALTGEPVEVDDQREPTADDDHERSCGKPDCVACRIRSRGVAMVDDEQAPAPPVVTHASPTSGSIDVTDLVDDLLVFDPAPDDEPPGPFAVGARVRALVSIGPVEAGTEGTVTHAGRTLPGVPAMAMVAFEAGSKMVCLASELAEVSPDA